MICSHTDPTYKEWKPVGRPIRQSWLPRHGSYLQGMETCDDEYNIQLTYVTRILPTRNGNYLLYWLLIYMLDETRILPTRNGNIAEVETETSMEH